MPISFGNADQNRCSDSPEEHISVEIVKILIGSGYQIWDLVEAVFVRPSFLTRLKFQSF